MAGGVAGVSGVLLQANGDGRRLRESRAEGDRDTKKGRGDLVRASYEE